MLEKMKTTWYFTQLEKIRKIKNTLYNIRSKAAELEQERLLSARWRGNANQTGQYFCKKIEALKEELEILINDL